MSPSLATGKPGAAAPKNPSSLNTETVRPAPASPVKRFIPGYVGEPIVGHVTALKNPDGTWVPPGGKFQPGAHLALRPYYGPGPTGDPSTGWNAAQVAKAQKIQIANYGTPGYVLRSMIPGGLDEGGAKSLAEAVARGADVASWFVPPGAAVKGAGLFGLGIKGLKGIRGVKDVAEAVPEATAAAAHTSDAAAVVRGAMPGAKAARTAQEASDSAARGKRFAASRTWLNDKSLPWEERVAKAKNELRGELPVINYKGFTELNGEAMTALQNDILNHPRLMEGQKIRLSDALTNAVTAEGRPLTRGELTLMQHVFGKNSGVASALEKIDKSPWKDVLLNVLNVPRTLQSTLDMSAFLRQGFVALARHPVITGRNFKTLVHSFASEDAALNVERDIGSRANFPMYNAGKVAFTGSKDLQPQEEQFAANMLEQLGGTKNPIRWSSRSYSAFLNKTRADIFDHLLGVAQAQGHNIHDEKFLQDLGNMVNVFTGRGSLPGDWERAAKLFNGIFFSPRLMASRLQMMGQPFNPTLHPFVRRQYQRAAAQTGLALLTVLGLAKANGLNVGTNPRSANFGKIKFGDTRLDLGAGFLQYAHLAAQLLTGESMSSTSTTGKVTHIYSGKPFQKSAHDVISGFFEGKLSPPLAILDDLSQQQTNFGPFNPWKELVARLTPLSAQDVYGVATNRSKGKLGAAEIAGAAILSLFGGGLQTYGPKVSKVTPAPAPDFGGPGSDSGGDPYFGGSGGGSGDPYFSP